MVQPQLHLGHDVIYKQASTLTGLAKEVTLNTNSNCFAKDGNCSQIKLGYEDAAPPLNMCTQMLWHYQPWDRGCTTTNPVCADIAPSPTSDVKLLLHHQPWDRGRATTNLVHADVAPTTHRTLTKPLVSPGTSTYSAAPPNTKPLCGSSRPTTTLRSGNTQAYSSYYQPCGTRSDRLQPEEACQRTNSLARISAQGDVTENGWHTYYYFCTYFIFHISDLRHIVILYQNV